MKDRLSESDKDKLKKDLEQKWEVPTSQLLDKLSAEISHDFKWEKNPWVYQESIKDLLKLKEKLDNKKDLLNLEEEINKLSSHLSDEKKKEFALAIKWAKEILKNSKDLISDIKDEINIFTPTTWDFTTKVFGQKYITRWKNPQNISDQLIGWWVGLFNSTEAIARISVSLLVWVWKSIPDTYNILTWKSEYDWFKDI